jgi:hypothetical protein
LSEADESELKTLWRELVKLFHPDRFADVIPIMSLVFYFKAKRRRTGTMDLKIAAIALPTKPCSSRGTLEISTPCLICGWRTGWTSRTSLTKRSQRSLA